MKLPWNFATMVALLLSMHSLAAQQDLLNPFSQLDKVCLDESRCLTLADMRGDRDMGISCFCRDVIVDARYVYFTYLLSGKDPNLNGAYLRLESDILRICGEDFRLGDVTMNKEWKWNGPEVVRTYPSDEVIERIKPRGRLSGRWVPFTVQLVYRDAQGRVTLT